MKSVITKHYNPDPRSIEIGLRILLDWIQEKQVKTA